MNGCCGRIVRDCDTEVDNEWREGGCDEGDEDEEMR